MFAIKPPFALPSGPFVWECAAIKQRPVK